MLDRGEIVLYNTIIDYFTVMGRQKMCIEDLHTILSQFHWVISVT